MEILGLGGSQFIGPRLVELLVRQGHEVSVLNRGVILTATVPLPGRLCPKPNRLPHEP